MKIEHWNHANELVTIDTEDIWLAAFAEWDSLVPTSVAASIASAIVHELETWQLEDRLEVAS